MSPKELESRASQGDAQAEAELGLEYLRGGEDPLKGRLLLEVAGYKGNTTAQLELARHYIQENNLTVARTWLEKAGATLIDTVQEMGRALASEDPAALEAAIGAYTNIFSALGQPVDAPAMPTKPEDPQESAEEMQVVAPPPAPTPPPVEKKEDIQEALDEIAKEMKSDLPTDLQLDPDPLPSLPPELATPPVLAPVPDAGAVAPAPDSAPNSVQDAEAFRVLVKDTSREAQNHEWHQKVLAVLQKSYFYNTEKVSKSGNMPYLAMELDDDAGDFTDARQPFDEGMFFAMSKGMGIVFFSKREQSNPLFSLTFGDLASIDLFNEIHAAGYFQPKPAAQSQAAGQPVKMSIEAPGDADFPSVLRQPIRDYIRHEFNVEAPKVLMMEQENRFFAFNVFPDKFDDPTQTKQKYGDLLWYMPTRFNLRVFKSTSEVAKAFETDGMAL